MNRKYSLLFVFLWVICLNSGYSQITLTPATNAQQLIQSIVGQGFTVFNASLNCPNGASGLFNDNSASFGITNGIVLTTGAITIMKGPNNSVSAGFNNGAPGDASLDSISNAATYDGCALEFDLVPACDTLKINYVFASEEYLEFVNKKFNDVFGFFIKGPGIIGNQNIALIPGTTVPVSINSLNPWKNSQYYVNNPPNAPILQYDGYSTPLTAKIKVNLCDTYRLKLVIADVTDGIYDSGVIIEGKSIECSPIVYADMASSVSGYKNCSNVNIRFCRTGDTTLPFVVHYKIGGNAINGVDYQTIPDSLVIPANQKCISYTINPILNGTKGTREITLAYQYGFCPRWDTVRVFLKDPLPFDAGPDIHLCSGDSAILGIPGLTNMTYSWQPTTSLSDPTIANPQFKAGNVADTVKYYLSGTSSSSGCTFKDSVLAIVHAVPTANFTLNADYCVNLQVKPVDASVSAPGTFLSKWYWVYGNGYFDSIQAPITVYPNPGVDTVILEVTDNLGCKDTALKVITVWPSPDARYSVKVACAGDSVFFTNESIAPTGGFLAQSIWNFGDGTSPQINSNPTVAHIFPTTQSTFNVQLIVSSDKGCVGSFQTAVYVNPKPTASFDASPVCVNEKMKFTNMSITNTSLWNFGDSTTSVFGNPTHMFKAPGTYTVELIVSTNFGCKDTTSKTVTVYELPKFNFVVRDTVGCPLFCSYFKAIPNPISDSIVSWNWNFGTGDRDVGDSATYCYKNKGHFSPSLIAKSIHGCIDTLLKPLFINLYPKPVASFNIINRTDLSVYEPTAILQNASSPNTVKWWWDFGDGTKDSVKNPPPHKYLIPSTYTITLAVKNNYGCYDSTVMSILIEPERTVYIPNAFTPVGKDSKNPIFYVYCTGIYEEADFTMNIFNRWGELLFTSHDVYQGWDGTYKGTLCHDGVYVYQVYFNSKSDNSILGKFAGTVTLLH